jgi:hypothetical protein
MSSLSLWSAGQRLEFEILRARGGSKDDARLGIQSKESTPQVRANGGKNAKVALTVFRHIDDFFGYRFTPAVHLANLNGAHYRPGHGRELALAPHR